MPDDYYQHVAEYPDGRRIGWNGNSWENIPPTSEDYYQELSADETSGQRRGRLPSGQWVNLPGQAPPIVPGSATGIPPQLDPGMRAAGEFSRRTVGKTLHPGPPQREGMYSRISEITPLPPAEEARGAWDMWTRNPMGTLRAWPTGAAMFGENMYNAARSDPLGYLWNIAKTPFMGIPHTIQDVRERNPWAVGGDILGTAINIAMSLEGAGMKLGDIQKGLLRQLSPDMGGRIPDLMESMGQGASKAIIESAKKSAIPDAGMMGWPMMLKQIRGAGSGKGVLEALTSNRGVADELLKNLKKADPEFDADDVSYAMRAARAAMGGHKVRDFAGYITGGLLGRIIGGSYLPWGAVGAIGLGVGVPWASRQFAYWAAKRNPLTRLGTEAEEATTVEAVKAEAAAREAEKAGEAEIPEKPTTVSQSKEPITPTTQEDLRQAEARTSEAKRGMRKRQAEREATQQLTPGPTQGLPTPTGAPSSDVPSPVEGPQTGPLPKPFVKYKWPKPPGLYSGIPADPIEALISGVEDLYRKTAPEARAEVRQEVHNGIARGMASSLRKVGGATTPFVGRGAAQQQPSPAEPFRPQLPPTPGQPPLQAPPPIPFTPDHPDGDLLPDPPGNVSYVQQELFVRIYGPLSVRVGASLGVAPNIIMSQWAKESGWGTSEAAKNKHNLAGIMPAGQLAAYKSPEDFAKAYTDLILNEYPQAIGAGNDVKKFNRGLSKGARGKAYYGTEDPESYGQSLEEIYRTVSSL